MKTTQTHTPLSQPHLARRVAAEFVGTGLLVTVVVGSGIAAQQLSPRDVGRRARTGLPGRDLAPYLLAQIGGSPARRRSPTRQ